jgi:uncharacterized protein DUF4136
MRTGALAAALLLAACYPGGAETVEDLDAVTTQHDPAASFSTLRTYALPDTIQEVSAPGGQPLPMDHSFDTRIIARVASNLDAIGLRRVDPSVESPDVNVLVTFAATRYTEYTSYPFYDLWPGWAGFGGYDGTWGVYYPWATGTAYVTVIDAGSLRIDMLDQRTANASMKQVTAIWAASIDGVLAGDKESIVQRIEKGIDKAFAQSSYL